MNFYREKKNKISVVFEDFRRNLHRTEFAAFISAALFLINEISLSF